MKPLVIKIGNSLLSDIVNCFEQLDESSKVRIKKTSVFKNVPKNLGNRLHNKFNVFKTILPPIISILTLILFSTALIYFYNPLEENENKEIIYSK